MVNRSGSVIIAEQPPGSHLHTDSFLLTTGLLLATCVCVCYPDPCIQFEIVQGSATKQYLDHVNYPKMMSTLRRLVRDERDLTTTWISVQYKRAILGII